MMVICELKLLIPFTFNIVRYNCYR